MNAMTEHRTPDITVGEWIEQAVKEHQIREALPKNAPIVQWVNRNSDEPPPPRNPVLDLLTSS
nr:hypothetical protein [uncultured Roseateles sp.]